MTLAANKDFTLWVLGSHNRFFFFSIKGTIYRHSNSFFFSVHSCGFCQMKTCHVTAAMISRQNISITPQNSIVPVCGSLTPLPQLQGLATTGLFSDPTVLPQKFCQLSYRVSFKWNQATCSFLNLAPFTQHKTFEIHPLLLRK